MRTIEHPDGRVEHVHEEDDVLTLLDRGAIERLTPEEWKKRQETWERIVNDFKEKPK